MVRTCTASPARRLESRAANDYGDWHEAARAAIKLAEENGAALVVLNVQPVYRPPVVAEDSAMKMLVP